MYVCVCGFGIRKLNAGSLKQNACEAGVPLDEGLKCMASISAAASAGPSLLVSRGCLCAGLALVLKCGCWVQSTDSLQSYLLLRLEGIQLVTVAASQLTGFSGSALRRSPGAWLCVQGLFKGCRVVFTGISHGERLHLELCA
jgi:hypothetical protein